MARSVNVIFSHPRIKPDLTITVNPDQIQWAYGLNTVSYPTYGGEVVQILSVYFDDMTISGTVSTVRDLEEIYMWFIRYAQDATQRGPDTRFDQHPVHFRYPERQWSFFIWPKSLPDFVYGRDVVAPTWTLTAAIKEPDATLAEQIKTLAVYNAAQTNKFEKFGVATADFGATGDLNNNPWASPDADPSRKGQTVNDYLNSVVQKLGDTYHGFVQDYINSDLAALPQFGGVSQATRPATAKDSGGAKNKKSKGIASRRNG